MVRDLHKNGKALGSEVHKNATLKAFATCWKDVKHIEAVPTKKRKNDSSTWEIQLHWPKRLLKDETYKQIVDILLECKAADSIQDKNKRRVLRHDIVKRWLGVGIPARCFSKWGLCFF